MARACASRSSFWTQKRAFKRGSVKRLRFSKGCAQVILSPNVTSGDLRGRCRNSCGRSENRENSEIHPDREQGLSSVVWRSSPAEGARRLATTSEILENRAPGCRCPSCRFVRPLLASCAQNRASLQGFGEKALRFKGLRTGHSESRSDIEQLCGRFGNYHDARKITGNSGIPPSPAGHSPGSPLLPRPLAAVTPGTRFLQPIGQPGSPAPPAPLPSRYAARRFPGSHGPPEQIVNHQMVKLRLAPSGADQPRHEPLARPSGARGRHFGCRFPVAAAGRAAAAALEPRRRAIQCRWCRQGMSCGRIVRAAEVLDPHGSGSTLVVGPRSQGRRAGGALGSALVAPDHHQGEMRLAWRRLAGVRPCRRADIDQLARAQEPARRREILGCQDLLERVDRTVAPALLWVGLGDRPREPGARTACVPGTKNASCRSDRRKTIVRLPRCDIVGVELNRNLFLVSRIFLPAGCPPPISCRSGRFFARGFPEAQGFRAPFSAISARVVPACREILSGAREFP